MNLELNSPENRIKKTSCHDMKPSVKNENENEGELDVESGTGAVTIASNVPKVLTDNTDIKNCEMNTELELPETKTSSQDTKPPVKKEKEHKEEQDAEIPSTSATCTFKVENTWN